VRLRRAGKQKPAADAAQHRQPPDNYTNRCYRAARRRYPYRVYVIELDPAACPRARSGQVCLYVGETADTPEERFSEHKRGYRASRVVRRHGIRLRPDIYRLFPPARTRDESRRLEARVAERLRLQGYIVFGGH
jgi:hypothetical protein